VTCNNINKRVILNNSHYISYINNISSINQIKDLHFVTLDMFDDLKSESFNFLHETSLINTLESDNTEHIIENNKVILKVSKSDSNIQHFENPIKDSVDNVINSFKKLWIIVYTIIAIVAVIIILWILIIIIYKIKKFKSSVKNNKNNKTKVEIIALHSIGHNTETENNNKQSVKGIKSNDSFFNIENAFWKNK
jgi:hypothetical protein